MKILISHSYFLELDPKEKAANKPYPPLAPLYFSSLLRQETGLDAEFYDVMFDKDTSGLLSVLNKIQPDVFILYDDDFNYPTKMCLENMRNAIFEFMHQKRSDTFYIAHGSDASDQAELYLKAGFDLIVHQNAETALLQVLRLIKIGKTEFEELPSLSFLKDREYWKNAPEKSQAIIEKIPVADWTKINLYPYREIWMKSHGYFSLNISTAHGCPYRCNWCAKPLYGRSYKLRPAKIIASEFRFLKQKLNADHIWVTDDIFGLKTDWLQEFADEMEHGKVRIPYKIQARADLMNASYIHNLKRSGCDEVWIGAESGSQKILDAMDKDTTIDQIYAATRLLKNAGIKVGFFLQYGYPGEELEDIIKTLKLVRFCLPDQIGISVSYPLKGTQFYEKINSLMRGKNNWSDSSDLALMFPGKYPPDFYRALHKFTHHYFGFVSLMRKQSITKKIRRFAAQYRHIPGMLRYRLEMAKYIRITN